MANRLASENSPYLLQHQDNPVDWFPWGDAARAEAGRRDVPILLSIGYAACHWCHVMAHESFEDPVTAEVMNDNFVCVKVDREERPDVDAIYMEAVQTMTGQGGWPMTVFLTPDGVPFYGGTYFPPEDRHGLPSFRRLLEAISEAWRDRRAEVDQQGAALVERIGTLARIRPSDTPVTGDLLQTAATEMERSFDREHGGFGGAPKFPQPMTVDLAIRLRLRGHDTSEIARRTLDRMAAGGMYDQIGGGFARYSVDRFWLVPHFEKMLYDNAQLIRTYARAYLGFGDTRYRDVAEATVAWLLREMRDPEGGFWSSLDADSEGEEGRFYLWDLDEVRDATGSDMDSAVRAFGFTAEGNFEGRNIPVWTGDLADPASVERARAALFDRRSGRIRPGTDDKVLTSWNGLAVAALAEAGVALQPRWVEVAADTMRFLLATLRIDGRLMRSYREGKVRTLGFAEDYAFTLEGCLALFEATGAGVWLSEARWAADEAIRLFHDDELGGFFTTGTDAERLVTRSKELMDNAIPSANSVFALELQRLASITGEESYEATAVGCLRLTSELMARAPLAFGHALGAVDLYTSEPQEIVVIADQGEDVASLMEVITRQLQPNRVIVRAEAGSSISPLVEGRTKIDGSPTVYVCRNRTCKRPVTDRDALVEQLQA